MISVLGEINYVTVDPLEIALCHLHLPEMFFCLFLSYMAGIAGLESISE